MFIIMMRQIYTQIFSFLNWMNDHFFLQIFWVNLTKVSSTIKKERQFNIMLKTWIL